MNGSSAGGLEQLHRLQVRLQAVSEDLARGPRQVEQRKRQVAARAEEIEQFEAQFKQLRMAVDAKSLQLRSNEVKINDLRSKLNVASSNREYDVIRSQIDADTMANSVLEDEILEGLEKVDARQVEIGQKKQALEATRQEAERIAREVAQAEPGLRAELERLQAEIRRAEAALPAKILEPYQRLVQAFGAGALAAVENGVCTACNVSMPPQSRVELNTGTIVFCTSCGRLLYVAAQ